MWVVNAQLMVEALVSPLGMGLFFALLILSMILGTLVSSDDGRSLYRVVSVMFAGLALLGVAWGVMQPAARFGGPRLEVFILGLMGLPPLLGWLAGWGMARFLALGLDRPQDSPTA